MRGVRKLVVVAVSALMGVFALAGCQTPPSQAAAIGDLKLDHADVDATVAVIEADLKSGGQVLPKDAYGDVRQIVVEFTLFNELARRYAQEHGVSVPARDYNAAAQQVGLPASNPYIHLYADAMAYRQALLAVAKPATPTEADLREAYGRYQALAGADAAAYEQVKPQLAALPEFQTGIGLRNELAAAENRYGLVVNPRYAPLQVPLTTLSGGQLVLVSLPLGDQGTGAVRDVT